MADVHNSNYNSDLHKQNRLPAVPVCDEPNRLQPRLNPVNPKFGDVPDETGASINQLYFSATAAVSAAAVVGRRRLGLTPQ